MAWSRTAFKGKNSIEPVSPIKQGADTSHVFETGLLVNLENKKNQPGAINFKDMSEIEFDGGFEAGTSWDTDNISKWFRDDGSTTT